MIVMQILKSKRRLGIFAILVWLFLAALITPLLFATLPASAQQKTEQKVKEKVKDEFKNVKEAKLASKDKGVKGEHTTFSINDESGKAIGIVALDSQEEILTIAHFNEENYGDPILSLDDARKVAKEYLKKWNRELTREYQVVKEEPSVIRVDADNKQAWVYNLEWSRKAGDIKIQADGCYMSIDARSGDVIFCSFPAGIDEGQVAKIKPEISKQQAISIGEQNCPDAENWFVESPTKKDPTKKIKDVDIKVDAKADLVYLPINSENHLIWRTTISYEVHEKGVQESLNNRIDYAGWTFDIDSVSGEILQKDQTK
jgi:hypothetical protein